MKRVIINILLLSTIALYGADNEIDNIVIADANITQDINTTKGDINSTIVEDINETVIQIRPNIFTINLSTKDESEIILDGNATKNLELKVVFLSKDRVRTVVDTMVDESGYWSISNLSMSKKLSDGIYSIYVSTKDELNNKSEVANAKGIEKDTTINGMVQIHNGSDDGSKDLINIEQLKSFYIFGQMEEDASITNIRIFNIEYKELELEIGLEKVVIDRDNGFKIKGKNLDLKSLADGEIVVVVDIEDRHNNTMSLKATINKDTTPPSPPRVVKTVKENNMIFAQVDKMIVYFGTAENDSTITATLYNKKYPKNRTVATVKTDKAAKWTMLGKDFETQDLKYGEIITELVQIDSAGNHSEKLIISTKKEKKPIFSEVTQIIEPEDYMPIHTIEDVRDIIKSVVVSDDYLIAASYEFLYYFDKLKCELIKEVEVKGQWINSLKISADKLVLALGNGNIEIRDLKSGTLLKTLKSDSTSKKMPLLHIELDGDSKYLVSSSSDGKVVIWDFVEYKKLYTLTKHQWDVAALVIKGDKLYTGSDDYSIKIWDIKTGTLIKSLKSAHSGTINDLVIYEDKLISASDDNLIIIRDMESGVIVKTLEGHKKGVTAIKVNHDTLVSTSKDRTVAIWNLKTYEREKLLRGHTKSVVSLNVSEENIITGSIDYKVRIWGFNPSLQTQTEIDETVLAKYDLIKSLELSSDRVTALGQTDSEIVLSTNGYILFYNAVTYEYTRHYTTLDAVIELKTDTQDREEDEWGDEVTEEEDDWEGDDSDEDIQGWEEELEAKLQEREDIAKTELQWINDFNIHGTKLTAALGYKNIKIWDIERNKAIALLDAHENSVLSIARDETHFITSSRDGVIKVWNDEDSAMLMSIDAHQWDVRSVVVDDMKIYSASDDYSIKVWDMESGDLIKNIKFAHNDNITKLLIYKDFLISSSQDGTIKYRDKNTGELLKILTEHKASVNSMMIDGEYLFSASDDTTVKIWNVESGELFKTLENGHSKGVTALMTTDDYIISGGKDRKITVWKYYE